MKRLLLKSLIIAICLGSCVEPISFDTEQVEKVLTVEGFISDVSYADQLLLPLTPNVFTIRLGLTSEVSNIRDEPLIGGEVWLSDDSDPIQNWDYSEYADGLYGLFDSEFKVNDNRRYKINIQMVNGDLYESDYERAPKNMSTAELIITEKEEYQNVVVGDKTEIKKVKGLELRAKIKDNETSEEELYNKWDFLTTYGTIARLNPSSSDINYRCFITSVYDNTEVVLSTDRGAASHAMFFIPFSNEKLLEGYSTLIRQHSMTRHNYQFWQDLENQKKQSDLFAPPPYNLVTNLHGVNNSNEIYGYFEVVKEKHYRWIFDEQDISEKLYYPESLKNSCENRPPRSCFDCRAAELNYRDTNTNQTPSWWDIQF